VVNTLNSLAVNGTPVPMKVVNGYVAVTRKWVKGDKIDLVIPMQIQQITADERINDTKGRVALRYGPLMFNVEKADQADINQSIGASALTLKWRPEMLDGIMTINGKWADGTPLLAIPNYVRSNRMSASPTKDRKPESIIWIKK